ncbi:hypothetical protein C2845_PM15G03560 [Panicum miliaceum]|uniref:Uncharacterized protein n=1 Tax=Panicum miliaceum TaxID=4540 RepID=A0A3L6Q878_PANMI|nr:hypothetical protein C2845_PM15G03560 [Panicum miliaceum]
MELLNDSLDQRHRAYAQVMEGNDAMPVLRTRAPKKAWAIHPQWVPRNKMQGPRKPLVDLMQRMQPFIDAWDQALHNRVEEEASVVGSGFQPTRYPEFIPVSHPAQVQYEERHGVSGSSYSASQDFGYGAMPQEMDYSQIFTQPQAAPITQEIVEDEFIAAHAPQRREIRAAVRYSPADYDIPRASTSARKPKRARGGRQGRGGGQA